MLLFSKINTSIQVKILSIQETESVSSREDILLMVQYGSLLVRTEKKTYRLHKHDILRFPPGTDFTLSAAAQNQIVLFYFDADFFDRFTPAGFRLEIDSTEAAYPASYSLLERQLEKLMLVCSSPNDKYLLISILYQVLYELSQRHLIPVSGQTGETSADYTTARIKQINKFLDDNCHLPIHLQDLAEAMFLTPQYVSRFIRSTMGTTFNDLLNEKRIRNACIELSESGCSVTEVAYNSGFSSMATFERQFQTRTGLSPAVWRREHTKSSTGAPVPEHLVSFTDLPESDEVSIIPVFFEDPTVYDPCWRDTINIGLLKNMLSVSYMEDLRSSREALRFSYVRFYDPFVPEIIPAPQPDTDLNFSALDTIFDFFIEIGVHPFLELSFKPYRTSAHSSPDSADADPFAYEMPLSESLYYLEKLLQHAIRRYGYREVSTWRFEIWAKCTENLSYLETPQEYLRKFKAFHDVIRKFLPDAMIGGPGFNSAGDKNHFAAILDAFREEQIRPDFFSIYACSYSESALEPHHPELPDRFIHFLSADSDYLLHTFQNLQQIISEFFSEEIPLFVTEFNSSLNRLDNVALSMFQASYLIRNMLALADHTKCLAYWHLSDCAAEMVSDTGLLRPGPGLLTRHGIPKPSWYAMQLLGSLEKRCTLLHENCIAATDGCRNYQFLICNYTHYNINYCTSYLQYPSVSEVYELFEPSDPRAVRVDLSGLEPGIYCIRKTTLGRKHGSLLDQMLRILSETDLSIQALENIMSCSSTKEVEQFTRNCCPLEELAYKQTEDGTFSFRLLLEPHDIILLNIQKKL